MCGKRETDGKYTRTTVNRARSERLKERSASEEPRHCIVVEAATISNCVRSKILQDFL